VTRQLLPVSEGRASADVSARVDMLNRMYIERKRFTGAGVEVRPGACDRHHSNLERLSFTFWAICDSVDPESWHGEVRFGSSVLLTTETAADETTAGRLAERALEAKVLTLFGE
jgi:hypothetical protein